MFNPFGDNNSSNSKENCISCNYVEYIRNKVYFENNKYAIKFNGMKVLLFASANHAKQILNSFCSPCIEYKRNYSENELIEKEYHCGTTRVLVTHEDINCLTPEKQEELEIRVTGQTSWGKAMRPSGVFSNWMLGRYYGRDSVYFEEKPNIIIAVNPNIGEGFDNTLNTCKKEQVLFEHLLETEMSVYTFNDIFKRTRKSLVKRYLDKWGNDRYNKGLRDGKKNAKDEYNRGYNKAMRKIEVIKEEVYSEGYEDGFKSGINAERKGTAEEELNKLKSKDNPKN